MRFNTMFGRAPLAAMLALSTSPILGAAAQSPSEFSRLEQNLAITSLPQDDDRFGTSLAVSGTTVAVGSPGWGPFGVVPGFPATNDDFGRVWVYEQNQALGYFPEVSPAAFVDAPVLHEIGRPDLLSNELGLPEDADTAWDADFGAALALDGDTLVVGAPFDGPSDTLRFGRAYVFRFDVVTLQWEFEAFLSASNAAAGDRFGTALALDGDRLLVGSPRSDVPMVGVNVGSVYYFERDSAGVWSETAQITPSSPLIQGLYGSALELAGSEAFVGAPGEFAFGSGPFPLDGAGAVYRLEQATSGSWVQRNRITRPTPSALENFGSSLSYSNDILAVGTPLAFQSTFVVSGAADVFTRSDQGTPSLSDDSWSFSQRLQPTGLSDKAQFGAAIELRADLLAVGAPVPFGSNTPGRVFLYDLVGGTFSPREIVTSPDPLVMSGPPFVGTTGAFSNSIGDRFGTSLVITGGPDTADQGLFIGSPFSFTGLDYDLCIDANDTIEKCDQTQGLVPPIYELADITGAVYRYRTKQNISTRSISILTGGTQTISVDFGPQADGRVFAILGSVTGIYPSGLAGSVWVPLISDQYSTTVLNPMLSPITPVLGTLDSLGRSTKDFVAPPSVAGASPGTLYHSAIVFDLTLQTFEFGSNVTELLLLP